MKKFRVSSDFPVLELLHYINNCFRTCSESGSEPLFYPYFHIVGTASLITGFRYSLYFRGVLFRNFQSYNDLIKYVKQHDLPCVPLSNYISSFDLDKLAV